MFCYNKWYRYAFYSILFCGMLFLGNITLHAEETCEHKPVIDYAEAATCEETGLTEGSHCSICYKILKEQKVVPRIAHAWNAGEITREASCSEEGRKTYKCKYCGRRKQEVIPKNSIHDFGAWKVTKKATVLEKGTSTRTCRDCNKKETKSINKIKATMKLPVMPSNQTLPMKIKQTTNGLKVTGLQSGDSVVKIVSGNKKIVTVSNLKKNACTLKAGSVVGTTTVKVTLKSGMTKSFKVKTQKTVVKTQKIQGIPKTVYVLPGEYVMLEPVLVPFTSQEKITYKMYNAKLASVSVTGKITGKKEGTTYVVVKSGSKSYKAKLEVE